MANILTLARIALIAPLAGLFVIEVQWAMSAAFGVFVAAALTDFFDGRIARSRGDVSIVGAALDPIADKMLLVAVLFLLVSDGVIVGLNIIPAIIIVLREMFISGIREAMARLNGDLAVSALGKWKTALQLGAVGIILATGPDGIFAGRLFPVGIGALWMASILTIWTGWQYTVSALQILRPHNE